ncbi:MAG: cation:proton antiporter [Methanomicrobiaceae archaeon]|nr:cation:proton antiporter [Methanomicrobiaceae archaeon]
MDLFLQILLLLATAKLFGELLERRGYPSLIGEIAAGIVLGPSLLSLVVPNPTLELFSDIGVVALLFLSGAEMNPRAFLERKIIGAATAIMGVAVPFTGGMLLGMLLGLSVPEMLFIAIALSITSIGVSIRILVDLKQLTTPVGTTIVSAAVLDDIIGVFLLGVLSTVTMQAGAPVYSVLLGVAGGIAFLALFIAIGPRLLRGFFDRARKTETHEMVYSVAIMLALGSAFLSHVAGMHYAIGAFLAGLMLGEGIRRDRILFDSLMDFGFGFFVTFFFASIGLLFSFSTATFLSPVLLPIILVAVAAKILGGFLGSVPFLTRREAILVGIGMTPRGGIELVVASVALTTGLIGTELFSAVTAMVIVTIIATPLLMQRGFSAISGADTGN